MKVTNVFVFCRFESLLGPLEIRLAWSLYKRAAFWRIVYGRATERPLGTIREEKGGEFTYLT